MHSSTTTTSTTGCARARSKDEIITAYKQQPKSNAEDSSGEDSEEQEKGEEGKQEVGEAEDDDEE